MNKEIVCECFNISKKDLESFIFNGVKSFEVLQDLTNIGTECKPCFEKSKITFEEILKKTLE